METQTEQKLKEVLQHIKKGEALLAQQLIDPLLDYDIECKELIYTNRCCIFLVDSIKRINAIEDKYVQSESILQEWKFSVIWIECHQNLSFLMRINSNSIQCVIVAISVRLFQNETENFIRRKLN